MLPQPDPRPAHDDPANAASHRALARLVRQEQAAAATYQRVIEICPAPAPADLTPILDGHLQRAGVLLARLAAQGGQDDAGTPTDAGPAPTAEAFAGLAVQQVIAALADLEGQGVAGYRSELGEFDDLSRVQVEADLLPAQERAVAALATLHSAAQPDQSSGAQA